MKAQCLKRLQRYEEAIVTYKTLSKEIFRAETKTLIRSVFSLITLFTLNDKEKQSEQIDNLKTLIDFYGVPPSQQSVAQIPSDDGSKDGLSSPLPIARESSAYELDGSRHSMRGNDSPSASRASPVTSSTGTEHDLSRRTNAGTQLKMKWEEVEADRNLAVMIKDVRGRIAEYAERSVRKQPTIADLEAEGTLYVQLLKAANLLAADANGLSDPYCKLMLGDQKQRSRKLYKTLDPVWNNEVFAFAGCLGQLIAEPLQLTMYDFDILSRDDKLGEVQIELADHTYCNEIRRDLTACLDTQGEVHIQVWWEPETTGDTDGGRRPNRKRRGAASSDAPSYASRLKEFILEHVRRLPLMVTLIVPDCDARRAHAASSAALPN